MWGEKIVPILKLVLSVSFTRFPSSTFLVLVQCVFPSAKLAYLFRLLWRFFAANSWNNTNQESSNSSTESADNLGCYFRKLKDGSTQRRFLAVSENRIWLVIGEQFRQTSSLLGALLSFFSPRLVGRVLEAHLVCK